MPGAFPETVGMRPAVVGDRSAAGRPGSRWAFIHRWTSAAGSGSRYLHCNAVWILEVDAVLLPTWLQIRLL